MKYKGARICINLAKAYEYGKKAFENGKKGIPALDTQFLSETP